MAVASSFFVEVPSYLYLVLFLVTLCIYLPAFWTRVPYYPTPRPAYPSVLAELPVETEFSFLDIGSGFGEMTIFLAKQRPNGHFVGVEIGIIPFLVSFLRAKLQRLPNVRFLYKSMWKTSLAPFTHVYAFLSPAPMERLWGKVSDEMEAGALFISNTFEAPASPSSVIPVKDARKSSLYLYRIP
jgi:SAM-dependent methyltransferase